MLKRLFACLFLSAFVVCGPATRRAAQAAPPLPACQTWAPAPQLRVSPTSMRDNTLFVAGSYPLGSGLAPGLLRSTDRGRSWQQVRSLKSGEIVFSANFSADKSLVVVSWPSSEAYGSGDYGATWRTVTFPRGQANIFALGDADHLYLGYGRDYPPEEQTPVEMLASGDGGKTWENAFKGLEVQKVAVSPAFSQDRTLVIAVGAYHANGGLVKSTDAGATWQPANAGIDLSGYGPLALRFSPAFAADHTIFYAAQTAAREVIYKSTDAGTTWRPLASPNLYPAAAPELLISPDYAQDQTLWYVSYYDAAVSKDSGRTWQSSTNGVWLQAAGAFCAAGGRCGVELFGATLKKGEGVAGDRYALYRSLDYGQSWQCLEEAGSPVPAGFPQPAAWLPFLVR